MSRQFWVRRWAFPVIALALTPLSWPCLAQPFKATRQDLTVQAAGAQIYECRRSPSGALAWTFREPLATLLERGKTVGRHFAGPTWELADGSAVVGKVEAQTPGATGRDIPTLTLGVASRFGHGSLDTTTTIKRIDTHGGMFSGPCSTAGAIHVEPYTALYVFSSSPQRDAKKL